MKYDDYGREIPDDTPVEVPVKFRRPPSIQELIAMHVRANFQVERAMRDDTDEDDFEEEDERDDILTPYELHAYAGDADQELRRAAQSKAVIEKIRGGKGEKGTGRDAAKAAETQTGAPGVEGTGGKGAKDGETGPEGTGNDRGSA